MQTIKLEVEDSKIDIVLNVIKNLKEDVISRYEVVSENKNPKKFIESDDKTKKPIFDDFLNVSKKVDAFKKYNRDQLHER